MPERSSKIQIEIYDAQDSDYANDNFQQSTLFDELDEDDTINRTHRSDYDDEDKILYTKIGMTEIKIDKILKHLLLDDEYITTKNIIKMDRDDMEI